MGLTGGSRWQTESIRHVQYGHAHSPWHDAAAGPIRLGRRLLTGLDEKPASKPRRQWAKSPRSSRLFVTPIPAPGRLPEAGSDRHGLFPKGRGGGQPAAHNVGRAGRLPAPEDARGGPHPALRRTGQIPRRPSQLSTARPGGPAHRDFGHRRQIQRGPGRQCAPGGGIRPGRTAVGRQPDPLYRGGHRKPGPGPLRTGPKTGRRHERRLFPPWKT